MSDHDAKQSAESGNPNIASAIANVIRFREVRPNWSPMTSDKPEYQTPMYKYVDRANSEFGKAVNAAVTSGEFRLAVGVCEPGRGAPLHDHTGEELMFAASGSWVVYFDAEEKHKVYLEPWDAILVPGNVLRGWRNVGREIGCFLNFSSVHDQMTIYRPAADAADAGKSGCS